MYEGGFDNFTLLKAFARLARITTILTIKSSKFIIYLHTRHCCILLPACVSSLTQCYNFNGKIFLAFFFALLLLLFVSEMWEMYLRERENIFFTFEQVYEFPQFSSFVYLQKKVKSDVCVCAFTLARKK